MPDLQPILARLEKARRALLLTADSVPGSHWLTSLRSGAWSAGEVIAHLMMVEGIIISHAGRMVRRPPKAVPIWKRAHLPIALAEWRVVRRRTPIPLDQSLLAEKETMLACLREVRERTLAFLEETRARDLSGYRWPHPFFGSLNLYDWFRTIAHHETHHTKQIQEIVTAVRKQTGNRTFFHRLP